MSSTNKLILCIKSYESNMINFNVLTISKINKFNINIKFINIKPINYDDFISNIPNHSQR